MRIKVLVVDDDLELLSLLERFLLNEFPQFDIVSTTTAQEAIRIIDEQTIDIVVSDFHLGPGVMNGLELLEWLRGGGNDLPFVMFTGKSREEVAIRALNLGAQFYLRKDDEESFQSLMQELGHHIVNSVSSKRIEDALAKSEARFRNLYESSMDGILAVSLDGRLMQCNQRFAEMLGYESSELMGMTYKDVTPESWHMMMDEVAIEVQQNERSRIFEQELLTKDRRRLPVTVSSWKMETEDGQPLGAWIIVRDISLSKMTERILRESEAKFRSLFEDSPTAIALFDAEGLLLHANKATLDLFGISNAGEILGYNMFADPDMPESIKEDLQAGNSVSFYREYDFAQIQERGLYKTSRSDIVFVDVVGAPFGMDAEGKMLGYTLQMLDKTKNHNAMIELEEQKEELSQFAHFMKHDITTHLLKMNGYAELLESDFSVEDVQNLKQTIQELKELLQHSVELADAGLIINSEMDSFDLDKLVKEVAETGLPKSVEYEQDSLPVVKADRTKVAQVFRNLLDNAIIHGSATKVRVSITSNPESHIISVSNNGTNISKKDRTKIFERGFSTKENHLGYGLAIVKKIVDAHGWRIKLNDSKQTTFDIIIPYER